jgi:hypothetical protein
MAIGTEIRSWKKKYEEQNPKKSFIRMYSKY